MVEAVMLWNEPNNLSHWDFKVDPDWKMFAEMVILAAKEIRQGGNRAERRPCIENTPVRIQTMLLDRRG